MRKGEKKKRERRREEKKQRREKRRRRMMCRKLDGADRPEEGSHAGGSLSSTV